MKILIATGIYPPDAGGPATYSKRLARELLMRGHSVSVLTYSDIKKVDSEQWPVTRIKLSNFKPLHYWQYWRAARRLGKDADIIFAQDTVTAGYPALLAARELKKPFVVKVTGDYSWEQAFRRGETDKLIADFQKQENLSRKIRTMRWMQTEVCRSAKMVITPAEYLKKLVISWGVEENRVKVVYNSVGQLPEISRDKARKKLNLKTEDLLILSVGRDVPWKGFKMLKAVASEVKQEKPGVILKILSSAAKAEVLQNLKAADVFVLNTGYEGFPHVVLEAMAMETSVITTNVCGNPELIKNEQNGLLVEYNNHDQLKSSILRVLNDPELKAKLVTGAKESVKQFSIDNMVQRTEEALQSCVY